MGRGIAEVLHGVRCCHIPPLGSACSWLPRRRGALSLPAGKLLQDWRRINVALTRARGKLLLVGDAATLGTLPLFERLLALVRGRGWYLQLPPGACAES